MAVVGVLEPTSTVVTKMYGIAMALFTYVGLKNTGTMGDAPGMKTKMWLMHMAVHIPLTAAVLHQGFNEE